MVTYQDFHFQTVESASCGLMDSREPCCYEPPEEDTGRNKNLFFFRQSNRDLMPVKHIWSMRQLGRKGSILISFVPF